MRIVEQVLSENAAKIKIEKHKVTTYGKGSKYYENLNENQPRIWIFEIRGAGIQSKFFPVGTVEYTVLGDITDLGKIDDVADTIASTLARLEPFLLQYFNAVGKDPRTINFSSPQWEEMVGVTDDHLTGFGFSFRIQVKQAPPSCP